MMYIFFIHKKTPNIAFAYVSLLKLKKGNSEMQNDKWVTLLIFLGGGGQHIFPFPKKFNFNMIIMMITENKKIEV